MTPHRAGEAAAEKTPALTPCAGAGAGKKEKGLGSNAQPLPAERGGNMTGEAP